MAGQNRPIVAIVGSVTTSAESQAAAQALGRELAVQGFRVLVYSSDPQFLEAHVVKGYAEVAERKPGSIQVHYSVHRPNPEFAEQKTHPELFGSQPNRSRDWEVSYYRSLADVDGVLLLGGGPSTLVAGVVALGYRKAILALASFEGKTKEVWDSLEPGRDLLTSEERALMAHPWSPERAAEWVQALSQQLRRRDDQERERRLEALRKETPLVLHAVVATVLFVAALACVPIALAMQPAAFWGFSLLFGSPLLAGVGGSTIRVVFDLRQGSLPLSRRSTITTAALGLFAGGASGLLFLAAQFPTLLSHPTGEQLSRMVPSGVAVGFLAGLTLDAVFRKLIQSDVVDLRVVSGSKG